MKKQDILLLLLAALLICAAIMTFFFGSKGTSRHGYGLLSMPRPPGYVTDSFTADPTEKIRRNNELDEFSDEAGNAGEKNIRPKARDQSWRPFSAAVN
jgi:hypothetical protein